MGIEGMPTVEEVLNRHNVPTGQEQVKSEQGQEQETEEQAVETEAEVTEETEAEVTEPDKTEVSEDEETISEEQKQGIIKAEYDNWQSKILSPITKERDALKTRNAELEAQLSVREDDRDLDAFKEQDYELDEDQQAKRKESRSAIMNRVREYEKNAKEVQVNMESLNKVRELQEVLKAEDIPSLGDKLGQVQRTQNAISDVIKIFMPKLTPEMQKYQERLNNASSPEHYNEILSSIKKEAKGLKQTTTVDTGRQSGGPGSASKLTRADLGKLDPRGKTTADLTKQRDSLLDRFFTNK